ncbi:ABC-type transport auxiliary lipoprotein family protein [Thiobacillus sp.]
MKIPLFLIALVLALGGCTNFGLHPKTPGVVYYVLDDSEPGATATPAHSAALEDSAPQQAETRPESVPTLLVLDTTTAGFYDTDQLVFSRSADTRGQYQFARWTERPGKRFADLLRARLERLGRYRITSAGSYVRADLMLDTRLAEFYHDATSEPGQVRLQLRAELIDLKQRSVLGRRTFELSVPSKSYDAAGAAQASSLAVGRVLDDLDAWLTTVKYAPRMRMQQADPTTKGETP